MLKKIRNLFYKIGIDIKFVKKNQNISAISHNSVEELNKYYSNPNLEKEFLVKLRLAFYKKIIDFLKSYNIDLTNQQVADVGCGIGILFCYIKENFAPKTYNGYDFSEEALKLAAKIFAEAEYTVFDIYNPINKTFDAIFCTEVLEHLLYPDKALKNLLSLMHQNSTLVITVPDGRTDVYEGHINFWSTESWNVFITQNAPDYFVETKLIGDILFAIIIKK